MSIVLKLTAKKGKPPKRGFDHYWSVIMDFAMHDKPFSVADIFSLSNTTRSDIHDYVQRLLKAELIERVEIGSNGAVAYRALVRQSVAPRVRRDGTIIEEASGQQRMWNVMRSPGSRQGFTAADVAVWGMTAGRETAKAYVKMLWQAGYLIRLDKGGPGTLATYRLDPRMDTGPLPPMILRTKAVFDQNRNEIMGEPLVEEVRP